MGVLSSKRKGERGPFAALLTTLILFIAAVPLADTFGGGKVLLQWGFTLVLVVGLGVARQGKGAFGTAVLLLVPALVLQWLGPFIPLLHVRSDLWRSGLSAGYLFYLILLLSRTLLTSREATLDTILGGVNVYLLLALGFLNLHQLVETAWPGSYVSGGFAISDAASHPHGTQGTTLLYFSFTTLTTLGYGDIAPVKPIAQFMCSAEAVIGQLFVAIFIGVLVALWVAGLKNAPAGNEPPADPS